MTNFPEGFDWQEYERLYSESDPARWAALFAARSEDSQRTGGDIGLMRFGDEPWRTEWRSGVLCYGLKGSGTQAHIDRLGANSRCVVLAVDISGPIDKKKMLKEVERIYEKATSSFFWKADGQTPIKKESRLQWARGLACHDLLQAGWNRRKIAQHLAPLWWTENKKEEMVVDSAVNLANVKNKASGPDSSDRTLVDRALKAVDPMIAGGWKELAYHPATKK